MNRGKKTIIRCKGGKDYVLVSLDEYNSLKETLYLLTGRNRAVLLKSIDELESRSDV
ncbi:type II toxin-antitoxin system Phd/YefM family antitoxin [Zunongwangia sp. F225]|uniref:Type II toxin-antitoxin system Phd/YefM family antitoxin n=1 Tax=Autumnicola psychrophila TaxID=3075592 RepID=A0ABU3DVW9_9FLAO|nr:type II toxin-antitoxin system Phd/YefM family antitoxin [Zunongwangia sp. F225]MDT0687876.1 type II toxin-antitoxin system Phd/YefM family antitoxin [Zunongwangia sp. F225]